MIEIERKFMVTGDFSGGVTSRKCIIQGYLTVTDGCIVRIRTAGDRAFITIKGPSDENMWSRYEFEQEIATDDASELMKLATGSVISKVRHYVPYGGHVWEVDVFCGDNEGLVVAEIELTSRDDVFDLPPWVGREVTGDSRYYNASLVKAPYKEWKDNE
ncbi:MAG: CYTH domain-containing protein [Tannerellaceae bacterium]|jgi:CYTH domain-containing protein|nr:CYTH domain-containing protein [Tannerellaceae bacterium]